MPITRTRPAEVIPVLIDKRDTLAETHGTTREAVDTFVSDAALAESTKRKPLVAADVAALILPISDSMLNGLVAFAKDTASVDASLMRWRMGFPTVLGSLEDEEASALIRVAVSIAGGTAE